MYRSLTVLALIPARSGSKRIPHKNIRKLRGQPLVAYAIRAAKNARLVDRVVVTTDSEEIAAAARLFGAEIPFLRPKHLARDTVGMAPVITHALSWLKKHDSHAPDIIVLVQPTSPHVKGSDIDSAIRTLVSSKTNSCVSVTQVSERPEWMFTLKNGKLKQRYAAKIFSRSQSMPPLFRLNGAVSASYSSMVFKKKLPYDPKSLSAMIMPRERSVDIDTIEDWKEAQRGL